MDMGCGNIVLLLDCLNKLRWLIIIIVRVNHRCSVNNVTYRTIDSLLRGYFNHITNEKLYISNWVRIEPMVLWQYRESTITTTPHEQHNKLRHNP